MSLTLLFLSGAGGSPVAPTVTTNAISNITRSSADAEGQVVSAGGSPILERGFVISTSPNPTTSDTKFVVPGGLGIFTSTLNGLSADTTYYVRAYAINAIGTSYGSEVFFTSLPLDLAVVSTLGIENISISSADVVGNVSSDGGSPIIERGFVFSEVQNPTITDEKIIVAGTTGIFTGTLINLSLRVSYYVRAYAINAVGITYGIQLTFSVTAPLTQRVKKRYYYKVYSRDLRYITTWSSDVLSMPDFRSVINGGAGQMVVTLARKFDDFGEGIDVSLGNRVEVWVADNQNSSNNLDTDTLWDSFLWDVDVWDSPSKSFTKLFSGYISAYSPILDDEQQYIDVTLLGFVTEASYRILKDSSGNTTIVYALKDPGFIMRDVIDKYRADGGTNINYGPTTIQDTGTIVSYTFKHNTLKECLDKIVELTPDGWYWYMDANGLVYLEQRSTTADHVLSIGKDIFYLQTNKRIENMANRVYVLGGGNPSLFNVYERGSSISSYGHFERKIQDGSVTDDTTADYLAKRRLDRDQTPETRSVLKVIDNNGDNINQGKDIESFRVGNTIQIKNLSYGTKAFSGWDQFMWDVDVWDSSIQYTTADILTIVSIIYHYDYIEIEAASRLPEVSKRIEDVNRKLDFKLQENLPTAPSARTV